MGLKPSYSLFIFCTAPVYGDTDVLLNRAESYLAVEQAQHEDCGTKVTIIIPMKRTKEQ